MKRTLLVVLLAGLVSSLNVYGDGLPEDSEVISGGSVRKLVLPKGYELLEWRNDKVTVTLRASVSTSGDVVEVSRLQRDESDELDSFFSDAAIKAMKSWKFFPFFEGKKKIDANIVFKFIFDRNENEQIRLIVRRAPHLIYVNTNPYFIEDD